MDSIYITVLTSVIATLLTIVLQKVVGNLLQGLSVWLFKPFKKGDKVRITRNSYDVASGRIMSVGPVYTKLKTYNRDVCSIVNNSLEDCSIFNSDYKSGVNYTKHIRISLDSNIDKAVCIILQTLVSSKETSNDNDNTNIIVDYDSGGTIIQYNVRTNDIDESYNVCSHIYVHLIKVFRSTFDITVI